MTSIDNIDTKKGIVYLIGIGIAILTIGTIKHVYTNINKNNRNDKEMTIQDTVQKNNNIDSAYMNIDSINTANNYNILKSTKEKDSIVRMYQYRMEKSIQKQKDNYGIE
jgi:hypothetical protein